MYDETIVDNLTYDVILTAAEPYLKLTFSSQRHSLLSITKY